MNSKNNSAQHGPARPVPWVLASLRICSDNVTLEQISQQLRAQPSQSHKLGDPVNRRRPLGLHFKRHVWILDSSIASKEPVKEHLNELMLFIEDRAQEVLQLLPNCDFDIVCAYAPSGEQGSFVMPASLVKRLGAFPVNLVVDVYADSGAI